MTNLCLLSESPVSTLHLLYSLRTQDITIDSVIISGCSESHELMKKAADIAGFSIYFVENANETQIIKLLSELSPDYLILMVSKIIRKPILTLARKGVVNTHAGILPYYRGVDSRRWAILEGGDVGVTVHLVDSGVDTGPILVTKKLDIHAGDTIQSISARNYYYNKWQALGQALKDLINDSINPVPQKYSEGRQYFWMHPKLCSIVDEILKSKV